MDRKGSLSVDLLFATFILLIIIGYTSTLISDRYNMVNDSRELVEARSLAESIAGAIDQVYAGGEGHTIKIKTPARINNYSYNVVVDSSGVLVKVGNRRGLAYLVPKKFSSDPTSLKSSTITLLPGKEYFVMNKREGNGENWIVIS